MQEPTKAETLDYDNSSESIEQIKEEIVYHVQAAQYLLDTSNKLQYVSLLTTITATLAIVSKTYLLGAAFGIMGLITSMVGFKLTRLSKYQLRKAEQRMYIMRTVLGLPDPMEGLR